MLVLLLIGLVSAIPILSLKPLRLELVDENFVQLYVGSPPRLYSFFVSLHLSDVELHSNQIGAQSHSMETLSDAHGTELFSLGEHRLRLPFIFIGPALAHTVHLTTSLSPSGTLGLGPLSPLWRYWRNFTYTKESILLGGYDSFLQMHRSHPPPFLAGSGLANGVPFELDYLNMDTQLPHQLFSNRPNTFLLHSNQACAPLYEAMHLAGPCRVQTEVLFSDQHIHLLTGVYYAAVQRSHDSTIHFGRRFINDMVLFSDPFANAVTLTQSASSFHHAETTAIFTALLLLLASLWATLALNQAQKTTRLRNLLIIYIEALVYACALAGWVVQFVGFRWSRFLDSFLQTDSFLLFFYLCSTTLGASIVGLLLLAWKPNQLLAWRIQLVACAVFSGLWSGFLPRHHYSSDALFLLLFSTMLCIALSTLMLVVDGQLLRLITIWNTLLSYVFLLLGTLRPLQLRSVLSFHSSAIAYLAVFCIFPSAYLFVRISLFRNEVGTSTTTPVNTFMNPLNMFNF